MTLYHNGCHIKKSAALAHQISSEKACFYLQQNMAYQAEKEVKLQTIYAKTFLQRNGKEGLSESIHSIFFVSTNLNCSHFPIFHVTCKRSPRFTSSFSVG